MIFTQVSRYAEVEKEGRYSLAAYRKPPPMEGWIFQAWRIRGQEILATGTAEECREACRKDACK